jgi:ribosomal subunit interface protein
MPFRVSGKNIDVGAALRARVNQRLVQATAKYFDGGFSGRVTIGKEGFGFRTECVVHLDSGIVLEAVALAADAYASADQAALRLENRLRRYKHRLKDHQVARVDGHALDRRSPDRGRSTCRATSSPRRRRTAKKVTEWNRSSRQSTTAQRLSVSEAVMEPDMTGRAGHRVPAR